MKALLMLLLLLVVDPTDPLQTISVFLFFYACKNIELNGAAMMAA